MEYRREHSSLVLMVLVLTLTSLAWLQPASPAWAALLNQQVEGLEPTVEPTEETNPTAELPTEITGEPTVEPTAEPTEPATITPTLEIPAEPTGEPTVEPTEVATVEPAPDATGEPVEDDPLTGTEADMIGQVVVEGRAGDHQAGHQVFIVNSQGAGLSVQTAADGRFSLNDTPAGVYTLEASSPGFLAARCEGVSHADQTTELASAYLLAGDLDNSGEIDIIDAVALGSAFNRSGPGEPADLNLDAAVDILDFVLMAANFGQSSMANIWRCQ